MTLQENIFSKTEYHVYKGLQNYVLGPLTYLIKSLGLECHLKDKSKKKRSKLDHDARHSAPNEKYFAFRDAFLFRKKKRKTRLKKKHHEEFEEVV